MNNNTFLMQEAAWVGAGGAIGALLRYGMNHAVPAIFGSQSILTAIFVENITGSFLIGIFFTLLTHYAREKRVLSLFLLTGLIGSYTTYSGFMLENIERMKLSITSFGVYFSLQLFLGFVAVFTGIIVAKKIVSSVGVAQK